MSDTAKVFKLGDLVAITIDPNGQGLDHHPTLSPSEAKAVLRDTVGKVKNAKGDLVDAKIATPKGNVSIGKAATMFLNWQLASFPDEVAQHSAKVLEVAGILCNGK